METFRYYNFSSSLGTLIMHGWNWNLYRWLQSDSEMDSHLLYSVNTMKDRDSPFFPFYIIRELESVGVTVEHSQGGFYCTPDFEVIRKGLAKRGIHNCKQMTDAMLDEIDVAVIQLLIFIFSRNRSIFSFLVNAE